MTVKQWLIPMSRITEWIKAIDKNTPIWVFHGREDQSIPISESDEMVKKLREMGYDVRFTQYKGV